ncbi:MAG: citrate synthase [Acidibacillus sp.]|uniref:Citrate synthase n=1 Tax=Sulfoacidibacillus ferrooxidans TaxID=2005001 RepID=A0A9X1V7B6_9BACL|nr:citrate synthase [Sulfoacidibacillus ferrooxidans]MCI0182105.1 Citrate synthase 2 [Sulfoacidibacillus ferrooxidans]MCY0892478.1 citrate synthase [Acidibacillus sp.]
MTDGHFIEGLEDVVALSSEICFIDGDEGRLVYRGYDIHDLVKGSASFEEVVYLLWHGELPTKEQLSDFDKELRANRALNKEVLAALKMMPKDGNVMEMLRTLVSLAGLYDPDDQDNSYEGSIKKATRLVAQMSTMVASIERYRSGQEILLPNERLNHAANFLYMLQGKEPDEYTARAFEIALILHADHELNASTFAARVTAGTLSDIYSATVSAIGALKGPLHGGANEQVMLMLKEIGEPSKAPEWIKDALAKKRRIMGFGHRVYHTEDPRATHLREMSKEIGEREGNTTYYEMSRIVEQAVKEQKGLYPNVDFYSASTYFMMGIPIHVFTPVFAVSRISGWTAHVLEQYRNNRLIRPRAEYVGIKRRAYISMSER